MQFAQKCLSVMSLVIFATVIFLLFMHKIVFNFDVQITESVKHNCTWRDLNKPCLHITSNPAKNAICYFLYVYQSTNNDKLTSRSVQIKRRRMICCFEQQCNRLLRRCSAVALQTSIIIPHKTFIDWIAT